MKPNSQFDHILIQKIEPKIDKLILFFYMKGLK
jgi:hypothetical protein